jgi:acyl carrier protein phosphodiesterase
MRSRRSAPVAIVIGRPLNHIAHFLLAPHTDAGAAGTLLADFHRGVIGGSDELNPDVAAAIALHRAVDGFVDRHPLVSGARRLFAQEHRRYSGVALDLYFDHCLARDWHAHASTPFDAFIASTYQRLARSIALGALPSTTHRFARAMIGDDWLGAFVNFEGVDAALARLNHAIWRRFARRVDLRPMSDELRRLQAPLDETFEPLFADLVAFVGARATLPRKA